MAAHCLCDDRTLRLPGTALARVDSTVDSSSGLYTVRLLGITLTARANLPERLTYSQGEQVAVTRLGLSTEYLILGKVSQ